MFTSNPKKVKVISYFQGEGVKWWWGGGDKWQCLNTGEVVTQLHHYHLKYLALF